MPYLLPSYLRKKLYPAAGRYPHYYRLLFVDYVCKLCSLPCMSEVSCIMRVCVSDTVTILQKVVYHKIAPSFTCDVTVFLVVYLRLSYNFEIMIIQE